MAKCKCGEPHDGWPGNDGGFLCQMCWEAECDKSWWAMVVAFDKVMHPDGKLRKIGKIAPPISERSAGE